MILQRLLRLKWSQDGTSIALVRGAVPLLALASSARAVVTCADLGA